MIRLLSISGSWPSPRSPCAARAQLSSASPPSQHDAAQDINRIKRDKKGGAPKRTSSGSGSTARRRLKAASTTSSRIPQLPPLPRPVLHRPPVLLGSTERSSQAPGRRKSLAETVIRLPHRPRQGLSQTTTVTSPPPAAVFHLPHLTRPPLRRPQQREPGSLIVFAAIDWIRDSQNPSPQPDAEYTLWIFPNHRTAGPSQAPYISSPAHSFTPSPAGWPSRSPAPASSRRSPPPSS